MSYTKLTIIKAIGLATIVITASMIGVNIFDDMNDYDFPDVSEVDIYDWVYNDSNPLPLFSNMYLIDHPQTVASGIFSYNLSSLELFYNVSSNAEWAIFATFTNVYNVSGYMDLYQSTFYVQNLSRIVQSLKSTIQDLDPFTEKIIVDHEQDERGIDTIELFIRDKSGLETSKQTYVEINIITIEGIFISVKIYDFGVIITATWAFYRLFENGKRGDYMLFDQKAVNMMYDNAREIETGEMSFTYYPINYYYYIEKGNLMEGLSLEYIQEWNNTITELKS